MAMLAPVAVLEALLMYENAIWITVNLGRAPCGALDMLAKRHLVKGMSELTAELVVGIDVCIFPPAISVLSTSASKSIGSMDIANIFARFNYWGWLEQGLSYRVKIGYWKSGILIDGGSCLLQRGDLWVSVNDSVPADGLHGQSQIYRQRITGTADSGCAPQSTDCAQSETLFMVAEKVDEFLQALPVTHPIKLAVQLDSL